MTEIELSQIEQHFRDSPNAPGNAALVFRLVAEIRRLKAPAKSAVIVPPAPPPPPTPAEVLKALDVEPEGFRPTPPASAARSHHKKGK